MKIGTFFLKSPIMNKKSEDKKRRYLSDVEQLDHRIIKGGTISKPENIHDLDVDIFILFTLTGGTESLIKKFEDLDTPVIIYTNPKSNSLPSAIEAREYLRGKIPCRIYHRNEGNLENQIPSKELEKLRNEIKGHIGTIGGASSWLVASESENKRLKDFGIQITEINTNKLLKRIENFELDDANTNVEEIIKNASNSTVEKDDIEDALKTYLALKKMIKDKKLNAFTIKCIDLIPDIGTTFCLSLSLLNDEGIIAGCEGDIRSLLGMIIGRKVSKKPTYMGNIADYNTKKKSIKLAHCTIPLTMTDNYSLMTHYETNSGVGIRGNIQDKKVTVFSLDKELKNGVLAEGKIIDSGSKEEMCRTQLEISINDPSKFVEKIPGNHQIVTYTPTKDLRKFLEYIGIKTQTF